MNDEQAKELFDQWFSVNREAIEIELKQIQKEHIRNKLQQINEEWLKAMQADDDRLTDIIIERMRKELDSKL